MPVLENVFSWSKSRDEQFRECQHKYYYDKYASWGGWDRRAPADARLAYILKNLKNRWAWKGESVHHVIENVLKAAKAGQPISKEAAIKILTDTMRADYRNSKARRYYEEPKKTVGLFEHEYEKSVDDTAWKKIHESSVNCLIHFYDSELYKALQTDETDNWLVIEDLEEFSIAGVKIYVKLDFARVHNGTYEIYDWKTGKTTAGDADVQIGTYVLYAMQKWDVGLDRIKAYVVNLSEPGVKPEEKRLTPKLLQSTQDFVSASVRDMQALLEDKSRNVPKNSAEFGYTANPSMCDMCNFFKICEKFRTVVP